MDTGSTAADRARRSDREVARAITALERGDFASLPSWCAGAAGSAHVVGITGPPGSGKSTLVDKLTAEARSDGWSVAVLAVDPSSQVTGGAVLGDRVRMSTHARDDGVYIRSMGTRGATNGLAAAARDAVRVLEAAGFDLVVVETVGVGQVELDVLTVADTVGVVMVPGLGDTMQMNKAGIMEIGDVYVVNMADRPETHRFVKELRQALALGAAHDAMPPILTTSALDGTGVAGLWRALCDIDGNDRASGHRAERRAGQRVDELQRELRRLTDGAVRALVAESVTWEELRRGVLEGTRMPREAARDWWQGYEIAPRPSAQVTRATRA